MTKILWALLFSSLLSFAQAQKMAPDFSLLGNDLKMHSLKEHQGKYVVLEWYNKGCPFVRKHYDSGNMQALQKQFTQQGVVWYTIISSAPGKQGFLDDSTLQSEKKESKAFATFILKDSEGKVGKLYEAKTTPQMVVINPAGEIIYEGAIDDKASTDESDIKTAQNYVSAVLGRALKGEKVAYSRTPSYGCSVKYP